MPPSTGEHTMKEPAYPEVLHEDYGINPILIEKLVVPSGTFSLRRSHYFKEIEQILLLNAEQRQASQILSKLKISSAPS